MSLKFLHVEGADDFENERMVFQAGGGVVGKTDVAIGKYIVLRARRTPDDKVYSGPVASAYWFETIFVKSGDLVVLYSKDGIRGQKLGDDGVTSHFFYWGLKTLAWTPEFKPAIILALTWEWE